MPREDWELEERLLPTHFIGKVDKSQFVASDFGPQIFLHFSNPEILEPVGLELKETTCWYSLGAKKGWQIVEGGKYVDGPPRFHARSKYGMLIHRVTAPKEKGGLSFLPSQLERSSPKDASVWEGIWFEMIREPIEYGEIAGREVESFIYLPIRAWIEEAKPAEIPSEIYQRLVTVLDGRLMGDSAKLAVARDPVLSSHPEVMARLHAGTLFKELVDKKLIVIQENTIRRAE